MYISFTFWLWCVYYKCNCRCKYVSSFRQSYYVMQNIALKKIIQIIRDFKIMTFFCIDSLKILILFLLNAGILVFLANYYLDLRGSFCLGWPTLNQISFCLLLQNVGKITDHCSNFSYVLSSRLPHICIHWSPRSSGGTDPVGTVIDSALLVSDFDCQASKLYAKRTSVCCDQEDHQYW